MQDTYILIVDADSGWENDDDILGHVDEGNATCWAEDTAMILGDC